MKIITAITFLTFVSASTLALAQDQLTGTYQAKNRYAMFEKLKNGDVRFYISGIRIGSRYPCNIGSDRPAILQMNGPTGGYEDSSNRISVEFDKNKARVIVGKSECIIDGEYTKTGGKSTVNWSFGGD